MLIYLLQIDFWTIIPKITSPLAALCFMASIIYLIIRSNDRKKAATLSVGNPEAQSKAVELILKSNPGVDIDRIKDPKDARDMAMKIVDNNLKRHSMNLYTGLAFTGIFALTFLLSLTIKGQEELKEGQFLLKNSNFISWAEDEAKRQGMSYAINSMIQHVYISDVWDTDSSLKRKASFRNTYVLSALKKIKYNDHVFVEQFFTSTGKLFPWAGSEQQHIEAINDGRFWVKFEMEEFETKPILTGTDILYSVPLVRTGENDCFGDVVNGPEQFLTCYPNSSDYIDNLTIIVESENVHISRADNSAYRKNLAGGIDISDSHCRSYVNGNKCTIVASWSKVAKGECVGLKINWAPPSKI